MVFSVSKKEKKSEKQGKHWQSQTFVLEFVDERIVDSNDNHKQELIYKQKQRKGKKEQSCQWREKGNSLNLTVTRKCKNFEQKMMMMSSKKIYFQRKPKKKARMKITVVLPWHVRPMSKMINRDGKSQLNDNGDVSERT